MRKNRWTKMIALILGAMMIWSITTSALAATSDPTKPTSGIGVAVLNNLCNVSETFVDAAGGTINTAKAAIGTECKLVLQVSNKGESLPTAFVYKLPARVQSVTNGSDSTVGIKWTYQKDKQQIVFNWTGDAQDDFTVMLDVVLGGYDLYNAAVIRINGKDTWYRLNMTVVNAEKPYDAYNSGTVVTDYCKAEAYDFSTTTVVVDGKEYVYLGSNLSSYVEDPKPYYTVELLEYKTAKEIGGMNGKTPRWLLPDGVEAYEKDNSTGGYHRNYRISLHDTAGPQVLFNFLKGKDGKYYRIKKSEIFAAPATDYVSGSRLAEGYDYCLTDGDYDFSDVVLTFNNKEYRYRATEIKEGKYDNYYTVSKDVMISKDRFHGNASWFTNESGWLDGGKETYTEAELKSNMYTGYHQDYLITYHDGNATFYSVDMYDGEEKISTARIMKDSAAELPEPVKEGYRFIGWKTESGTDYDMTTLVKKNIKLIAEWEESNEIVQSVTITSDWPEGKPAFSGTKITLTAHPVGFDDSEIDIQWQRSKDPESESWENIEGAKEITYTYKLNEETAQYYWRVEINEVED